ncbi:4-hydroxy-tetrahydrodipicolinate synthase [Salibacterium salarium]|uniref:4-hydroxy-tetrahydrodipicolinate synthase n=1 Tax=Salibacterium salarium TaxID=284579 RepID=A0A428MVC9_9BACI|nr:4-hydroxy-tetrahydrodipicolinate synthase [Salibacterium salarium]RSL30088.1 4-hydroxy-tetrahydrodipicolinate synthase [Salibacterium salarium]
MLKGIVPALLTPMTADDEINEKSTRELVNHLIKAGVHGIFALGTNGEFHTLTKEEKLKVATIVKEEINGRVPLAVGTGGNSTSEVIELSQEMENIGVDVLSIITPYFDPLSQDELIDHYRNIAGATNLPIILYNMPSRTGVSLHPDTVATLSKIDNIVGIKDSSGNFDNILKYIENTDDNFSVLSGSDSLILWTLIAGGSGAVAATANVFPEIGVSIYNSWKEGHIKKAQTFQENLRTIRNASQLATVPAVYKKAVELKGIAIGPPRPPVKEVSADLAEKIQDILNQDSNK